MVSPRLQLPNKGTRLDTEDPIVAFVIGGWAHDPLFDKGWVGDRYTWRAEIRGPAPVQDPNFSELHDGSGTSKLLHGKDYERNIRLTVIISQMLL